MLDWSMLRAIAVIITIIIITITITVNLKFVYQFAGHVAQGFDMWRMAICFAVVVVVGGAGANWWSLSCR